MQEKKKNTIKTVGLMMAITLVGKVLGLVRDMLLGHNFATGAVSTAFLTASRIPRIFFDAIFASAISSSFIPVFNEYLQKGGKKEAYRLSNAFITVIVLFTVLISGLGIAFSDQITALMADGFDAETAQLCSSLLKILFPTIIFTGVAFSTVGILQSLGEFNIPAALSVASNGVVILYYVFLCDKFGIYGLAAAFLIGWASQAVIQIPSLLKRGYIYRPSLRHEGLKKVFLLMLPVMVSTWIQPINLAVSTKFASHIFSGSAVSAIEYANTLYTMVAGILVLSIANVVFPELSRLTGDGDRSEFGSLVSSSMRSMLFLLIPMTAGLMLLARPIIRLLYEWGQWDAFSTDITSRALVFLSTGMIGYGIQNILSRVFYAEQNGRIPLITGLVSILLNVVLCAVLSPVMDVAGLALASSVSSTVSALLLLIPAGRRCSGIITAKFWLDLLKMALCAVVMCAAVWGVKLLASDIAGDGVAGRTIAVLLPAVTGAAVYFAAAFILRVPEMRSVISSAAKKLRKGGD